MSAKLIIFEGIPGSGKTTIAKKVNDYLLKHDIDTTVYLEGDIDHPVDLYGCAYLSHTLYEEILLQFKKEENLIKKHTIFNDDYILLRYKNHRDDIFSNELTDFLVKYEFCYANKPVVPLETYINVFKNLFAEFANNIQHENKVVIFESTLFQHQIHDIHRNYKLNDNQILDCLSIFSTEIEKLNPVVFYFSQQSVSMHLKRTAELRNIPKFGTEKSINFWTWRKELELKAIDILPISSYIIDNSDYQYEEVFSKVIKIIIQNIDQ